MIKMYTLALGKVVPGLAVRAFFYYKIMYCIYIYIHCI